MSAGKGFRGALVPRFRRLLKPAIYGVLVVFDLLFVSLGMRRFRRRATW